MAQVGPCICSSAVSPPHATAVAEARRDPRRSRWLRENMPVNRWAQVSPSGWVTAADPLRVNALVGSMANEETPGAEADSEVDDAAAAMGPSSEEGSHSLGTTMLPRRTLVWAGMRLLPMRPLAALVDEQ